MIGGFPPKLYGNPELPREKLLAPRITGLVPLPYCLEPYCAHVACSHLLLVTRGLLEGSDDHGPSGGHDRDLGLAILHNQLDGDAQSLPVLGSLLGNVLSDLLGRETQGTDLGSQR